MWNINAELDKEGINDEELLSKIRQSERDF